jgi:hypothetical protein
MTKIKQPKKRLEQRGPTLPESEGHDYRRKVVSNEVAPIEMQESPPVWFTTSLQRMDQKMQNIEIRSYQRLENLKHWQGTSILTPLNDNSGKIPPNFPKTIRDLIYLRSKEVNALLKAYDLPFDGNLRQNKPRLGKFIGVNQNIL